MIKTFYRFEIDLKIKLIYLWYTYFHKWWCETLVLQSAPVWIRNVRRHSISVPLPERPSAWTLSDGWPPCPGDKSDTKINQNTSKTMENLIKSTYKGLNPRASRVGVPKAQQSCIALRYICTPVMKLQHVQYRCFCNSV